jgi:hypothetical protein
MIGRSSELKAYDLWLLMSDGPRADQAMQWQAKNGVALRTYATGDTAPSRDDQVWQRLECIQSLEGPSAGQPVHFHYVVEADVLPENDAQLNAWYQDEHLPGLAAVLGTIRAARYRRTHPATCLPKYYACYDLVTLDVTKTEPWLAVRHTAWSDVVRPMFLNTVRTEFIRATHHAAQSPL